MICFFAFFLTNTAIRRTRPGDCATTHEVAGLFPTYRARFRAPTPYAVCAFSRYTRRNSHKAARSRSLRHAGSRIGMCPDGIDTNRPGSNAHRSAASRWENYVSDQTGGRCPVHPPGSTSQPGDGRASASRPPPPGATQWPGMEVGSAPAAGRQASRRAQTHSARARSSAPVPAAPISGHVRSMAHVITARRSPASESLG